MKKVINNIFYLIFFTNCFASENMNNNNQPVENQKRSENIFVQKENKNIEMDVDLLIEKATQARENAYCPYSKFKVGSAVLSGSGKIYTGCNVENASYGLTNCAERTAIFKMVSKGEKKIKAIAIVLGADDFGAPCGACRQVIYEFGQEAQVIMATVSGNVKIVTIKDLLPYAFCLDENN